jgi:acyl-CoA synthetase (AMP-forming)/AMP-acid ligase II/acyl carrier protein
MEKGWEQIVAVMGILAAGAAYVPIEPNLPQERFLYLLENSQANIVLTQSCLDKKLFWTERVVRLCLDIEDFAQESKEPLQPVQTPDDLAYVIYTSGSTGLPKGVMITHRNVVNVVVHTNQRFNISSQDRILALTALNHDLSVYDIFGLLSAGGTIVMPDACGVKDPSHWAELIVRERVTLWNSVPAMMEMLVDYAESHSVALPSTRKAEGRGQRAEGLPSAVSEARRCLGTSLIATEKDQGFESPQLSSGLYSGGVKSPSEYSLLPSASCPLPSLSLRLAIMGGDWLPVSLPNRLKALVPEVQILSIGGPTETTIWNIGYLIEKVDPNWKSIPYGQPMANAKYYILNEALEDCPVWVPGEMYCAGVQLAKGYWRDEEKTNAKFITHPRTGERLYRTGDLGRYLPDGNIEFLGRVDFQIKIRGYRIEAGEIEAALTEHPGVRSAVVTAVGEEHSKQQLVAYIVPEEKLAPTIEEISEFIKKKLPHYMVPSGFVLLNALPLSANGKVDRRALLDYSISNLQNAYIAPRNEIEQQLTDIWQEFLGVEQIGIYDNFFELNGDSLLATQIISRLYKTFQIELPISSLLETPTVAAISEYIENNHSLIQKLQIHASAALGDREEGEL